MFPLKNIPKNEVNVITPNPPSCISPNIIPLPKSVNAVAVSTTINPVTQTALVDVKKASINEMPPVVALGNRSKAVPIIINPKKLRTKIVAGFTEGLKILIFLFDSSAKKTTADAIYAAVVLFKNIIAGEPKGVAHTDEIFTTEIVNSITTSPNCWAINLVFKSFLFNTINRRRSKMKNDGIKKTYNLLMNSLVASLKETPMFTISRITAKSDKKNISLLLIVSIFCLMTKIAS